MVTWFSIPLTRKFILNAMLTKKKNFNHKIVNRLDMIYRRIWCLLKNTQTNVNRISAFQDILPGPEG